MPDKAAAEKRAESMRPEPESPYHAIPEQGGDIAFEMLRRAMRDEGKAAS